ncbi:la-related protein 7 [Polyergus mexicanus]|uniref:la-related protein 7 n=1 Tax=Polyergus mexicanus TaxID=615972 RepID=UPI0038B41D37
MVMEEQGSDMELASENIPVPQVQELKVDTIKRNNKSSASHGKPRLRKKALHASILKQMEFYFSDANLSKDRFLSELLKTNPYVDLDVFTQFNKLRELTIDTNRIAKALQKSTILKVSEDGTKVCRITPINKKENIDECTVYVQNLPPDADHDWIISIFSKFGLVEYVSIPRYKSNRKIKGFAFVEFDTPNSAQECLKVFRKKGCVLPYNTAPHEVLSISTFDETNQNGHSFPIYNANSKISKSEDIKKEKASEDENKNSDNISDNEMNIADNDDKQNLRKRKLIPEKSFTTDENAENIKVKKKRKEAENHSITDQQIEKEKASKDETEDNDKTCDNETDIANNSKKQSIKKRKLASEKIFVADDDIKVDITENSSTENPNKNISRNKITEKKKKRLTIDDINIVEDVSGEVKKESHKSVTKSNKNKGTRSAYLNTSDDDKVTNNEAEENLQTGKHSMIRDSETMNSDIEEASVDEKKKKKNRKKRSKIQEDDICNTLGLHVMAKPDWKRLRNKYLELQRAKMQLLKGHLKKSENITGKKWYDTAGENYKSKNEKDNAKISETEKSLYGRINYTPGIIVKVEMDEPCTDPQSFKMELRDNNSVKYIDVTHGSCEAYIRCDTAEAAQSFVQKSYEGKCLTILKDDDEKSYWDKIARDREEKLNRKGKVKQRGRDKLLKRAEKKLGKCIKFDQD